MLKYQVISMKRLLLPILLLFPLTPSAQQLHSFSNGEVADAEKINENFSVLNNDISKLESSELLFISTFPSSEFELDFGLTKRGASQTLTLPSSPDGFDLAFWGATIFLLPDGYFSANVMGKWRWATANFSDQLHSLCQPDRDVGFIPLEASYVMSHGTDIIALRTSTASISANTADTSGSVACVKIKASGDYEFNLHMNYQIANGHGRFACAQIIEQIGQTLTLAKEGSEENMIDLYGINVTGSIGDVRFSAVNQNADESNFFGKLNIPASC